MSLFIAAATLLALIAAAFVALPLLRRPAAGAAGAADRGGVGAIGADAAGTAGAVAANRAGPAWGAALASAVVMIALAAALYAWLGNFQWSRVPRDDRDIAQLARHLDSHPQDLSGWLSLGQQYTQIGQFHLAVRSYERANALAGGDSVTAMAGIAEAIVLGGDGSQRERAAQLFERVLKLDPDSPKALFYTAVAAMQDGNLPLARTRFQRMLDGGPPANIQAALRKQIAVIDAELHPVVDARTAIRLHVTLAPALAGRIPAGASLFVFVQAPQGGAPLAVKRLDMRLPQDVELSAADAMIAGRAVRAGQVVTVAARISANGSPLGANGDLYGQIRYTAGKDPLRELQIDRRQ